MPFWRLYYHLIWPTKNREHLITAAVEARLYPYLVSKAADNDTYVYAINGWYDHIHLVVAIPPKHSVAEIVKRLKGASSHYLSNDRSVEQDFAWHRGYGALSVGERQRSIAEAYVHNQKEHHARQTTSVWLERADELDEGSPDAGASSESQAGMLRETTAVYDLSDPFPF
jgi:REP element-mobilizing transposase RayT